ncbi:hypothetical protein D3C80_1834130 [compost metagenome]
MAASTVAFGALAKCWTPEGLDMAKALEASYATDASAKTGGAAFGKQSLDTSGSQPHSYFDFRNKLSEALLNGSVSDQTMHGLMEYAGREFSLAPDEAAEWVDRFLSDLKTSLSKRSKP